MSGFLIQKKQKVLILKAAAFSFTVAKHHRFILPKYYSEQPKDANQLL